jgi:rRNA small subunit pseudouridine methyltransferase Nep1
MSSSEESSDDEVQQIPQEEERPSKKSKTGTHLSSTPLELPPSNSGKTKKKQLPVIVLLDQASLETIKNRRGLFELLNCDDHRELCKKKLKKDPNMFRPDILHQEVLALLDSPLNKAGLLKIYISTTQKVLIEVNPSIRIPRTYKRFAGLMVQLLHKMKIKAGNDGSTTLLKVIKNPFSQHLPAGTRCFGLECEGTLYSPIALAKAVVPLVPDDPEAPPTCFVVGAMSTGNITLEDHPYIEKMMSISAYPLSGAASVSRIMTGIEHHWGIV